MNVVDSSGWLEYFTDGPHAGAFKPVIADEDQLIVPTICVYEVFKITLSRVGEDEAVRIAGLMSYGRILDFDREVALAAVGISVQHQLAMADSIIYASAQINAAMLWTQDAHFKGLPGVQYIAKEGR